MTVNSTGSKISYQGNGSTTTFSFPFATPDTASIVVAITDSNGETSVQSVGSYSIVLNAPIGTNPTPTGGIVTYPITSSTPNLPVGSQLTIARVLAPVQPVSLSNQSIIYPPVIEKEFDYLTMLDQQGSEIAGRAFTANIVDPTPRPTVPIAQRRNHWVYFDTNGDLIPADAPVGTAVISAAMQPVVSAPTLPLARAAMGIRSTKVITAPYGIQSTDDGTIINATGPGTGPSFFTISLGPAAGFPPDFTVIIINNDQRGKQIAINTFAPFILWPTQFLIISGNGTGGGWVYGKSGRWRSSTPVTFKVDYVNGTDDGDGLGVASQAFKTIQYAVNILETECDGPFSIQLANGTHQVGTGVIFSKPLIGADGYTLTGDTVTASNVFITGAAGATLFTAKNNAVLTLRGMSWQTGGGSGTCLLVTSGAIITLSIVRFGAAVGGSHMRVENNGSLIINGTIGIAAGADAFFHLSISAGGFVSYVPGQVVIEGAVNLTYFVAAAFSATCHTFAGSPPVFVNGGLVTGTQYLVSYNSVVTFNGPVPPGTIPGIVNTGGIFV